MRKFFSTGACYASVLLVSFGFCSCNKDKTSNQEQPAKLPVGTFNFDQSLNAVYSNTSVKQSTSFEDGTINPFTICTTQTPNYGQAYTSGTTKCIKFYWAQSSYNGTRMTKGAEACSSLNFYSEGWYGFHFYLPSSGFPTNKELAIAQVFSNGGGTCSSWTALLIVRNNALYLQRRNACVTPTEVLIASDIQRNAWKPVIIHFKASHENAGTFQVWYAGAGKPSPTYSATGINFGFGVWDGDVLNSTVTNNEINLKFGMYCYDDPNYTTGETRTIYFDNVTQLVGNPTNAWDTVNPNQ